VVTTSHGPGCEAVTGYTSGEFDADPFLCLIRTENSSKAAPAAAEEFRPDLILLDVMMPGLNGGDLANAFHASPTTKGVPVVFLTAAVIREEVRARNGLVGGLPFLAKPVNLLKRSAAWSGTWAHRNRPGSPASDGTWRRRSASSPGGRHRARFVQFMPPRGTL